MNVYKLSSHNSLATNSSGGQLLKWKVGDTYIKTSTLDKQSLQTKFMYESYAEVIASRIANRLGLNAVKYRLCEVIIDNSIKTIACESKDFKPAGYHDMSFGKLMQIGKLPVLTYNDLASYNSLINSTKVIFKINVQNYIDTIILFDSLVLNEDRHYGNFGLLLNSKAHTIPIFDNGNSLFCHKHTEGLTYDEDLISYLKFKPFSINCNLQMSLVQKNLLNLQLLNNYIQGLLYEMEQQGLPKDRSQFIKDLLKSRIHYIQSVYR